MALAFVLVSVALVFFFCIPVSPGIEGECFYRPDEYQSLSFPIVGMGVTYAQGHFFWSWQPLPFCI